MTARLRQEQGINPLGVPAKKLPLTISSLADSTLSLRAITQVKDALRFVPAVQMKSTFGAFREISVRGFYNTIYMVDGVRDERSTLNSYPLGDLYNVDQIEVLKGPASVLYGYAATGGVVNVTRRVPTEKFILGAHVRGGSLGYFDLGCECRGGRSLMICTSTLVASSLEASSGALRMTRTARSSRLSAIRRGFTTSSCASKVVMTSTAPMRVLPLLWRTICIE